MSTNDLPATGTRWGDIPPEMRARLPVGTVLGPAWEDNTWSRAASSSVMKNTLGRWVTEYGLDIGTPANDRVIFTYPHPGPQAQPMPVVLGTFADLRHPDDRWAAHTATTPKEPTMTDADRAQVALSTTEAERDRLRHAHDRVMVRALKLKAERDEARAKVARLLVEYAPTTADDVHLPTYIAQLEGELADARAEIARLRAALNSPADLPTYPRASHDEPGAGINPPPGWEWVGGWSPSGAMTQMGVPVWRRDVRRVAS